MIDRNLPWYACLATSLTASLTLAACGDPSGGRGDDGQAGEDLILTFTTSATC